MARYHILIDFLGSQDGRFTEPFTAGTEVDLSDYLAACAPAGSIRSVDEAAVSSNKNPDATRGKRKSTTERAAS